MDLRRYQVDCSEAIEEHLLNHRSTLAVLATGLGKTVVFADVIRRRAGFGRAMVLAHRKELINQAAEKIAWVTGMPVDVEMADRRASSLIRSPVIVSSIQTQISGGIDNKRMHLFDPMEFGTLVIDEFHHGTADSYRTVANHYLQNPALKMLGVTATPKRNDRLALGSVIESCAFTMGIRDGIGEGWLVPLKVRRVKVAGLDLSNVTTVAGDFNQGQLGKVMGADEITKATALATMEHSQGRKTLVFCASVDQARIISAYLNGHRQDSSRFLCGETPDDERDSIVDDFRKSRYQYLVNYSVLLEGFDVWDVACVVNARPTKNSLLLEQMIGRGTRPNAEILEGVEDAPTRRGLIETSVKPDTIVVDFMGRIGAHKLAKLTDVLGGNIPDDVRELAETKINNGCDSVDAAIEQARAELIPIKVAGKVKYSGAVEVFDLFGMDREVGSSPVEDWQKEKLEKWRIPLPDSGEEADAIIEEVRSRTRKGLVTYRMARTLKRYGYPTDMSFKEGHSVMDALANNGWRPIR